MPTSLPRSLAALVTLIFLAVLVRTAWISDDALITLRTVLNVTHGYGATFNIAERVQTYTHPLWAILLTASYLLLGNVYFATFALSIVVSLSAFWLAVTRALSAWQAGAAIVILLLSRAFVDYSTSGLENPLSSLLLALTFGVFASPTRAAGPAGPGGPGDNDERRLTALATLTSLLYLTRPDNVLFVLPLLGVAAWRVGRARAVLRSLAIGAVPAIGWTIFALVYYGAPFPNTAYAKLGSGTPRSDLIHQGLIYLADSIDRDPLTLTAVAFGLVAGLARGSAALRALAAGVAAYLLYVVWIGGDFMTGRFLAVPLFAAALVIGSWRGPSRAIWIAATCLFLVVGATAEHISLLTDSRFNDQGIRPNGITDERGVFFKDRSLVRTTRVDMRDPDWPRAGHVPPRVTVVRTCGLLGAGGLDWGPYRYWLDECALADPLLARLPAVFNPDWRMGHFRRVVPDGYAESVASDTNALKDGNLHQLYDDVRLVTQSPSLFTRARWAAIVRLNTGRDDRLIDRARYRHEGATISIDALGALTPDGTPIDASGTRPLLAPLTVTCPDQPGRRYLDIALSADSRFRLTFVHHDVVLGTIDLGPVPEYRRKPGLESYTVDVPARATEEGLDMIVVARQSDEDAHAAMGHLLLDGSPLTDPELHHRVAVRDGVATQ